MSFLLFPVIYIITFFTGGLFTEIYRTIIARILSIAHAWYISFAAISIILNKGLFRSFTVDSSYIRYRSDSDIEIELQIMIGYLCADLFVSYVHKAPISVLIHHLVGLTALSFVNITGCGYFIAVYYMLTELSTPFLQVSKMMLDLGYKGFLFKVSGVLLVISYIVVRLLPIPYLLFLTVEIFRHREENYVMAMVGIISIPLLSFLNIFWFHLVLQKIFAKDKKE